MHIIVYILKEENTNFTVDVEPTHVRFGVSVSCAQLRKYPNYPSRSHVYRCSADTDLWANSQYSCKIEKKNVLYSSDRME